LTRLKRCCVTAASEGRGREKYKASIAFDSYYVKEGKKEGENRREQRWGGMNLSAVQGKGENPPFRTPGRKKGGAIRDLPSERG